MKSILDRSFVYTPSTHTDIRERFEKERARIADEKAKAAAEAAQRLAIRTIGRKAEGR